MHALCLCDTYTHAAHTNQSIRVRRNRFTSICLNDFPSHWLFHVGIARLSVHRNAKRKEIGNRDCHRKTCYCCCCHCSFIKFECEIVVTGVLCIGPQDVIDSTAILKAMVSRFSWHLMELRIYLSSDGNNGNSIRALTAMNRCQI